MAQREQGGALLSEEAATTIPDKLYFRIGEVAALCGVPAYVLRFWESEFPQLKPNKGGTGQRLYRRRDVEMALRIRTLLYEGKFTIPGARQALRTEQRQREPQLSLSIVEGDGTKPFNQKAVRRLKRQMQDLLEILAKPASPQGSPVQAIRPARSARAQRNETSGPQNLFS